MAESGEDLQQHQQQLSKNQPEIYINSMHDDEDSPDVCPYLNSQPCSLCSWSSASSTIKSIADKDQFDGTVLAHSRSSKQNMQIVVHASSSLSVSSPNTPPRSLSRMSSAIGPTCRESCHSCQCPLFAQQRSQGNVEDRSR